MSKLKLWGPPHIDNDESTKPINPQNIPSAQEGPYFNDSDPWSDGSH